MKIDINRAKKIGDYVEQTIGKTIENRLEADDLDLNDPEQVPEPMKWYRISLPEGISGDGSGYHTYISKGKNDHLVIILSGGGVAWNEYTAARPVTGGKVAAGLPNFYWNNLRPFTQLMNINIGITNTRNPSNPFSDWNFIVITYATGDFHIGNSEFEYRSEAGEDEILYFAGYKNFNESMKVACRLFEKPDRILVAGNSAGAFAVPALAGEISDKYYSDCDDITLFSDSGLLLYKDWKRTAAEVWHADESFVERLHSDNPTVDWFESLYRDHGDRFRYLYASSTRDYLLSSYYNDIMTKQYTTDKDVQDAFYGQLKEMVGQLKAITDDFHFYIFDWPMLPYAVGKGGTVHTALKEITFASKKVEDITMAEWLYDQTGGKPYDIGIGLLE
ncbi:MAG: pectinacetylesterase family protein [Lachnospiraceae bacterium]|nr:pectinacetylesterase family protein [Lachnospiraceae bacterium]